ncbi:MAG TPA: MarR family transcriptional regulator [Pseudonocardia sp.]
MTVLRLGQAVHQYRTGVGLGRYGLDTSSGMAIIALHVSGPLTPSELAAMVNLTPPATTELLDRLDRAGYIRRAPHPTDRRKTLVSTTGTGDEIVSREWAEFARVLRPALRNDDEGMRGHTFSTIVAMVDLLEVANQSLGPHPV